MSNTPAPLRLPGILLILLAVLANEWTLGRLIAEDGVIGHAGLRASVAALQIGTALVGILLVRGYRPRLSAATGNVLLLMVTLGACAVVLEVALRILPPAALESAEPLPLFTENPRGTGSYRLRPNLDLHSRIGSLPLHVATNSHGMHWREVDLAKPAGKQRIAFIGDSFTFGCWVDRVENSFVGVFESQIDTARYEVMNFGVGGYGLADMRLQLTEEVLRFDPDYVFLMFFVGNDFRDTYLGSRKYRVMDGVLRWDAARLRAAIPAAYHAPDPPLPVLTQTLQASRLYRLTAAALAPRSRDAGLTDLETLPSFNSFAFWSQRNYPPVGLAAVDVTLKSLDEIWRLTSQSGATLVIVTIPFAEQVYAPNGSGRSFEVDRPQRYVADFAAARGIPYFDLLPPLRAHHRASGEKLFWSADPHFNPAGHALAGRLLGSAFDPPER